MTNNFVVFKDGREKDIDWLRFVDKHNFIFRIKGCLVFYFGRIDGQFYNYFSVNCDDDKVIKDKVLAREIKHVFINGVRYDWEVEE